MGMKVCFACGIERRSLKRALVTGSKKGRYVPAMVCQECAAQGVLVCAMRVAEPERKPEPEWKPKLVKVMAHLRALSRVARTADDAFQSGRAEGLDGAVQALRQELDI